MGQPGLHPAIKISELGKETSPSAMSGESDEDLRDQYCDPEHPISVSFQEVSAAAYKIKGGIERTPCAVRSSDSLWVIYVSSK